VESPSYKHLAPTGQSTQDDYCCTSKLNLHSYLVVLFPKPLEPVSQFRASFSFVREYADEQRERLGVSRDP